MIQVFRHAVVFGLAPLLQNLVGMVLLPVYTHYLSARDYGELSLLTMTTGLFSLVLRLELRAGFMRAHVEAADDGARAALLAGGARLLGGLGLAGALVFALACEPLCRMLLGYPISAFYVALLALGLFVEVTTLAFAATLQAQLRSGLLASLGIAQFAVSTALTVLCVIWLRTGPVGFFVGGVTAAALGLAVMVWRCVPLLRVTAPDWGMLRGVVKYSLPLLLAGLLYFVVSNADRFIVSQLLSVADLGVYAMTRTLANFLLTLVFMPLQGSLDVWRHKVYGAPDGGAAFAEIFRIAIVLLGIAAVGLDTFGADAFVLLADPRFAQAIAYLPLLSAAVLLQAGYTIVASAFYVTGMTGAWTRIFALGAIGQVAASLALVPLFGIAGAALGILTANLLLYAGAAWRGRAVWPVPYPHAAAAGVLVLVLASSYARRVLPTATLPSAAAADAATLALFVTALFALRVLRVADLAALAALASTQLGRFRNRAWR